MSETKMFSRIWSEKSSAISIIWILLRGFYCFLQTLLFFPAYFGFIIPVLWAKRLWPRLYWAYEGQLYKWLQGFVAFWGVSAGYHVNEYGDDIKKYGENDRVLAICNHQSTADVPTLFAAFNNKGVVLRKTLWIMSGQFRFTPFGIVGRMHGDHFIKQGKVQRERQLDDLKAQLQKVFWNRDRRWVIIFPEGGFFYKRKESDMRYAKKNGFPQLKYLTLPRVAGVQKILQEIGPDVKNNHVQQPVTDNSMMKQFLEFIGAIREKKYVKDTRPPIQFILDVTIAYPNFQPLSLATQIFGTRDDCDIAVHYRIFDVSEVPYNDETALRDWMYNLFVQKDKLLENYYRYGTFSPGEKGRRIIFSPRLILGQHVLWLVGVVLQIFFYRWIFLRIIELLALLCTFKH